MSVIPLFGASRDFDGWLFTLTFHLSPSFLLFELNKEKIARASSHKNPSKKEAKTKTNKSLELFYTRVHITMAPPVGLIIESGKNQWKVGKEVGTGACASVHLLQEANSNNSNSDTDWVIKIAPLPTKITKNRKTLPERNAHLIYYEELMYQSQFNEFQGDILPRLPAGGKEPPSKGQDNGYTYFIMERMQAPLWDMVPTLLHQQKKASSNKIDIGPIAEQLLTCVELLHQRRHLVIDVKPENFMLAFHAGVKHDNKPKGKSKKRPAASKSSSVAEELASKIRLLDLGLVAPFKINGGHRSDDGISEIIGTPLYSSLKVHNLHTPSRRDDLECIGYVVAELIIRLVAASNGTSASYEGKSKDDMPSYLPWSQESSDDAIGKVKLEEVTNIKSSFYQRMGDKETAEIMKDFFAKTNAMKYKEEPDYDAFRELLSDLLVSVDSGAPKKRAAAAKKQTANKATKPAATTSRSTRTTRSKRAAARVPSDNESESGDEIPQKQRKVVGEESDDDTFMDVAMMDVDSESESVFHDAEEMEEMDWEPSKENTNKSTTRLGLTLMITDGPHSGENYELLKDESNSVIIGKNPKSAKPGQQEFLWPLPRDSEIGDAHVQVDLRASKQSSSIKITDLKSGTTLVDQKALKRGANTQAFIGGSFTIGESTFAVKELSKVNKRANASIKTKKTTPLAHNNQTSARAAKKSPYKKTVPAKTKPTAVLAVVSGPHKGETFDLVKDEVEIFNVGSARSAAKKGTSVVLASDESIDERHAVFTLVANKKLVKVAVKDVSNSGTWVNNRQTAKGKEHMTFVNDLIRIGDTEFMVKLG